jgi:hypothetical protein
MQLRLIQSLACATDCGAWSYRLLNPGQWGFLPGVITIEGTQYDVKDLTRQVRGARLNSGFV